MPQHRHAGTAWQINPPLASHGLGIRDECLLKFHKLYNHKEPRRNYQGLSLGGSASAKLSYVRSFLVKGKHNLREMTLPTQGGAWPQSHHGQGHEGGVRGQWRTCSQCCKGSQCPHQAVGTGFSSTLLHWP